MIASIGVALLSGIAIAEPREPRPTSLHACCYDTPDGAPLHVKLPPDGVFYWSEFDVSDPEAGPLEWTVWQSWEGWDETIAVGEREMLEYAIDPSWRAPAAPPRIIQLQRYQDHCCRYDEADGLAIQLDQPAAAIRVHWVVHGREYEEIVVPKLVVWRDLEAAVFRIGTACVWWNVPIDDLREGTITRLVAIRHDGSEIEVEGLPWLVDLDAMTPLDDFLPVLFPDQIWLGEAPPAARASRSASPTQGLLSLALLAGAVLWGARRGRAATCGADVVPPARAGTRRRSGGRMPG